MNIYQTSTKENESVYKDLFNNTDIMSATDTYWKEALKLYNELSDENKEILLKIIKQIEIDSISNILVVLDGTVKLENGEVNVIFKNNNEIIN